MKLPLPPLRRYDLRLLPMDLVAGGAVLFLAVPQGLAYATLASLPPAMGLFAAAIPTIVGAIFRSSWHVVSGPTNAISLLVGGAVMAGLGGGDPIATALTLALMVGVFQVSAGLLRLGTLVDYISSAVVLGYITGAAMLIALGQLYNLVGTEGPRGAVWVTLLGFVETLPATKPLAVGVALGTIAAIIGLRWLNRRLRVRIPSPIIAVSGAIAVTMAFDLHALGLETIADLSPIPSGLPPLTMPRLDGAAELVPIAIACTVLSLVESSAVARSIASRTGQRLDASTEFFGQGLSNVAAAFFGGYPVSGSLSRSALLERAGGRSRVAGVITGVLMIGVLLALGPVLDATPLAALAGLLIVLAYDLVDTDKIRRTLRASPADALAFAATTVATWLVPLDKAIYIGIGISLVLFLRNARLLTVRELFVAATGRLVERGLGKPAPDDRTCARIRVVHVEGSLFFGAAGELQAALDEAVRDPALKVLIIRLKRTRALDVTAAAVLEATAARMHAQGRHLLLVGMTPESMAVLVRSGAAATIGEDHLFPTRERWFSALEAARIQALAILGDDHELCPLREVCFTGTTEATVGPL